MQGNELQPFSVAKHENKINNMLGLMAYKLGVWLDASLGIVTYA